MAAAWFKWYSLPLKEQDLIPFFWMGFLVAGQNRR